MRISTRLIPPVKRPTGKAASLFKAIPAQLAGNAHRYQITPVIGEVEDTALLTLLHDMEESKTVNVAHHVDDPNIGFPMTDKWDTFKMYVGDTGLFVTLAFADKEVTDCRTNWRQTWAMYMRI